MLGTRISPRTSCNIALSWRCPPVTTIDSGRPCPSTAKCTFVLNPPRDLPITLPAGSISHNGRILLLDSAPFVLIMMLNFLTVIMLLLIHYIVSTVQYNHD